MTLQRGTGWPSGPSLPTIFRALLLCPALVMARRETSHAVYQLCVGLADTPVTPKPAAFFEELLLAQLKDIADPEGACVFGCKRVFVCMCVCVRGLVSFFMCTPYRVHACFSFLGRVKHTCVCEVTSGSFACVHRVLCMRVLFHYNAWSTHLFEIAWHDVHTAMCCMPRRRSPHPFAAHNLWLVLAF